MFSAFPRIIESNALLPTVAQRTATLQKAIDEVRKLRAKQQVNNALQTRNGPKVNAIHNLPLNSLVLI